MPCQLMRLQGVNCPARANSIFMARAARSACFIGEFQLFVELKIKESP